MPKVTGIWKEHLSLQGFAAGSFVSRPPKTVGVSVQTFEEYQVLAGSGSGTKAGPFFCLSPCQCVRPWDFYNPN